MAKILHNGDWFEQLSTEALYEEEYERILIEHAASLFPAYRLVKFKKTVYSETSAAKADLALVHRRYRDWWVVEAELGHHPFEQHVRPQVQTLSRALYGESEAQYLHAQDGSFDLERLHSMVKGYPPGVLVIVNAPRPDWARELRPYRALVTVLEVFRSEHNRYLYRLNGEQPAESEVQSSECTVELARMLRLHSPGILPVSHGETLKVQFRSGVTEWGRIDIHDRVYLSSAKPISLNKKLRYQLIEIEDGSFLLQESK
ncbi:hypothetical protein LJ656_12945 [Paraburkholderia sp. MMS20-SJTR3]|uniref:Uncharacterized protein n=1 Tax=Paraburkholderia sejongensis TaxID=2886946 RepID=A0ABS8JUB6_9BURK|nr:hypothetical protein [Paraburkholderia sp. MMS20-SJTR3]MCC8393500.1 hypothetical protein [Paraburkholderia sp. MMS20-SJTR3]